VIRLLPASACAWFLAAACPCSVLAQAHVEVILNSDAVGSDALKVLRSAFHRDGFVFLHADTAPGCSGAIAADDVRARVWVTWQRPESRAQVLQLCFQDHCQSTARTIESFARLDAPAREQLITVVESGLAALEATCPLQRSDASILEPAPSPSPKVSTASDNVEPDAADARPLPEAAPDSAAARTETVRAREPTSQNRSESIPSGERAASTASASTPDASPGAPPTAASLPTPSSADAALRPALAFGASYGFTRWTESALAQKITGMVAYGIAPQPIYVGFELSYTPEFSVQNDGLAITSTCVRIAFDLAMSLPLYHNLMLDVHVGPALEWLSSAPATKSTSRLNDSRSVSHADPLVFARLGPALRVYPGIVLGLEFQLDTSWMQRTFGFTSGAEQTAVFAPDRTRLSFALNARAEL
jgi:hypothetical protein